MKHLLPLLILAFTCQNLSAQFQICNSSTTQVLRDIYFIDQDTGIAVGDSGTIVRSVDGGLNWTVVMSNDTVALKKVQFFDAQNGITIGSDVYTTNDAGLTWLKVSHSNDFFDDVEILNSTTCLISGHPNALIKSTDAGATFFSLQDKPSSHMGLLSFINENIGYACNLGGGGNSPTLKTLDGGVSWDTIMPTNSVNTVMEAMSFVSESVGFKGGWYNPHLEKTSDSAQGWGLVNYTDSLAQGQILDFHIEADQPNAYYSSGWYGQIFKSTDGGNNWQSLHSGLSNTTSVHGIYFLNDSVGWAVGYNGTIIKTTTGGTTVGIDHIEAEPKFSLYPNPTHRWLSLKNHQNDKILQLDFYHLNGQKIMSQKSPNPKIDLEYLPKGIYYIHILTSQGEYVEKLVKE